MISPRRISRRRLGFMSRNGIETDLNTVLLANRYASEPFIPIRPGLLWNQHTPVMPLQPPPTPTTILMPIQASGAPAQLTVVSTPTSDGTTAVTPAGASAPVSAATTAPAAMAPPNSIMKFLTGSMFGGIPNWTLVATVALITFGGSRK